jgi:hypothetical protein
MTRDEMLDATCRKALIDGLRPQLKDTIDDLIRKGWAGRLILDCIRKAAGHPKDGQPGALTVLGAAAYLEQQTGEHL